MLNVITDIEKAINARAEQSALALALTLPDVCGQVKYQGASPSIISSERYIRWYNEYVVDNVSGVDGKICYKLRCAYLHSGNTELNQRKNDEFPIFQLRINTAGNLELGNIYSKQGYLGINVEVLCCEICEGVRKFCCELGNNELLSKHNYCIVDGLKEDLELQRAKEKYAEIKSKRIKDGNVNQLSKEAQNLCSKLLNMDNNPETFRSFMLEYGNSEKEKIAFYELMDFLNQ